MQQLEVTCSQLKSELQDSNIVLVDCRTPQERDFCQISPSEFLPLQEFYQRVDILEDAKSKEVVVYCHHGVRSLQMTMMMLNSGFESVRSLKGGIDRWSIEIDHDIPRY